MPVYDIINHSLFYSVKFMFIYVSGKTYGKRILSIYLKILYVDFKITFLY